MTLYSTTKNKIKEILAKASRDLAFCVSTKDNVKP